jgi:hypothetical protein
MQRLAVWMVAGAMLAGLAGCCASPYRFYQNAWGWNDPVPDCYPLGTPAPRTTPPGPKMPAVEPVAATVAR